MAKLDKLKTMLDNIIKGKPQQAQVDFHDYLQDKMQAHINPVDAESEAEVEVEVEKADGDSEEKSE